MDKLNQKWKFGQIQYNMTTMEMNGLKKQNQVKLRFEIWRFESLQSYCNFICIVNVQSRYKYENI